MRKGILSVTELCKVHCPYLVAELGLLRLLEGVVLQRDYHLLVAEIGLLQLKRGIPVIHLVRLGIVYSAEHLEREVILALGHLEHCGIRDRKADIALARGMVIDQNSVHHIRLVVLRVDSQHISVNAVVESSGRDIDFLLCLSDVITKRENLVVGDRDEVVDRKNARILIMPAHIVRGVSTLVNDMPADFMAISSLFSAICPTVITEARSVASGSESGSIVALPHPRNSSMILSPKPLPTSSSIYSHRNWSMRMNTTTIRIPKNGPKMI